VTLLAGLADLERDLVRRIACEWAAPWIEAGVPFVDDAWFGAGVVAILLLLVGLSPRGRERLPRAVLVLLATMGLAHGVRAVLWWGVPRDRPGIGVPEEKILRGSIAIRGCASQPDSWVERSHPPRSSAFPSSHAVTAASCAVGLGVAARWAGALGWLFAFLVGYGRVFQGKHWPTDVLGGFAIAALVGWAVVKGFRRLQAARGERVARTAPETPADMA
jgi:undecaprenyl-diphosphatase